MPLGIWQSTCWSEVGGVATVVNLRVNVHLHGYSPPALAATPVSPVDLGVPQGAENMDLDV